MNIITTTSHEIAQIFPALIATGTARIGLQQFVMVLMKLRGWTAHHLGDMDGDNPPVSLFREIDVKKGFCLFQKTLSELSSLLLPPDIYILIK